ncbi:PIG-P-domain-containing protein [Corynespora cassiicola Philippines]|uniref:PIG-P-domain-containing protein n=1 Tax=Corynespora cassiicola Philippines TaxID=1448308 RepID=A0A2T2P0B1_CORCC|nr:PIG-P-domain-containing protein [Corynespora cassiicola Philippines]
MPPQSRGNAIPTGFQSKSTPNLSTTLQSAKRSNGHAPPDSRSTASPLSPIPNTSPSEPASIEDNLQEEEVEAPGVNDSEESGSDDSDDNLPTSRPLYASRSQTHLPPHAASTLFPPFYNRPPTPLPPSPSLTSLLRPSFSTTTSRPTTPDSSDVEVPYGAKGTQGTNTPASSTNLASITKSARHAPTVPRASPKVPTYEYYGFALYMGSSAAFLMYILWAYVPSPMLHQMGIHYYPSRWWALAIPCWMVVLVLYIYVALASYNTRYLTLPLSSCENLVDECAQVAVVDRRTGKIVRDRLVNAQRAEKDKGGKGSAAGSRSNSFSQYQFSASEHVDWKSFWSTGTDAVMDVPIGGVCEILYGQDSDG